MTKLLLKHDTIPPLPNQPTNTTKTTTDFSPLSPNRNFLIRLSWNHSLNSSLKKLRTILANNTFIHIAAANLQFERAWRSDSYVATHSTQLESSLITSSCPFSVGE